MNQFPNDNIKEKCILDIDILQNYGINVTDIKKLKSAGICTLKGIQMITKKKLCTIKGISEAKVDKIVEAVNKVCSLSIETALDVNNYRKLIFRISTGSLELDKLLGGGLESMAITEIYGEFRTGKTQLSHMLCITSQIEQEGYLPGKAFYIDTESTFRPERLKQIASQFNLDWQTALQNILYCKVYTSEQQYEVLDLVAAKFHEAMGEFRVLILDSVMALFRVDYSGRGELSNRQQKLAQFMSKLKKISEEYNVAVFITNQVTADPGAALSFQADAKKPVGGHVLAHSSTIRLALRKGRGDNRIAKIISSPELPENEATFSIGPKGIQDCEE